jgi:hypothetical protein
MVGLIPTPTKGEGYPAIAITTSVLLADLADLQPHITMFIGV